MRGETMNDLDKIVFYMKEEINKQADVEVERIQKEADEIRMKATEDAMKTREGAELYAEQVLTNLEQDLTQLQQVVKNGQIYMEKLRSESLGAGLEGGYSDRGKNRAGDFVIR